MSVAAAADIALAKQLRHLPPPVERSVEFPEIETLFSTACYSCHGPDKQRSGLRLDLKEAVLRGGDHGPAIVPGDSAKSLLIQLVAGLDPDRVMPQKGERLSAEEIGQLRAWIDQGADWPESESKRDARLDHWAFQPPVRPAPPEVRHPDWVRNPIDNFILARLEKARLTPAPPADRLTLIRRLTFDLHGLPPTPAEIDAFVADKSPEALPRLVDRLLASPRYGERWARHWLDVARFCESQGFERDKIREHSWRYRDYVISSLNDDKPYPQFVREQIAGDVLEPITRDGIIATGFLIAGPWDEVGAGQASTVGKAQVREEELEDMIGTVGQTFLGLTINCARCHDHMFDPIPQQDYYRIKAAFEGVRHGDRPILTPEELKAREQRLGALNRRIAELEKTISGIENEALAKLRTEQGNVSQFAAPTPMARWTFAVDAIDEVGELHSSLKGGATVSNGRLKLNGKDAYAITAPLPRPLGEKTLEAWVALANRTQRGSGVLGVETKDGVVFDAIVLGERKPRQWIAGSNQFLRTQDLPPFEETAGPGELVHLAVVYADDNSITIYRNGELLGRYLPKGEESTLRTFDAGDGQVLFGVRHARRGFLAGEIEEARLYDRDLSAAEVKSSFQAGPSTLTRDDILKSLTAAERQQHEVLARELAGKRAELKDETAMPLVYAANARQPEPTHRLARGDVLKKREVVSAAGLSAIPSPSPEFGLAPEAPESLRRIELASWITSADNPLFARVMANRVWHYHFGRGIVATPNDFGHSGEKPSHPELLDWLAHEFIAQGWSVKKLHRLIVLSSTYQQSAQFNARAAEHDTENRLLWRFSPRRLEAEAVRDAMLAISGQLNHAMGGPGYRPFDLKINNSWFYTWADHIGEDFNRRTVYRIGVQSAKDPLLDSLDCPDFSTKTPVRSITTTPIQALALMNNAFVQRQAGHFAERVAQAASTDMEKQVQAAYRLALGREPNLNERASAIVLATEHGMKELCWVLFNSSEFLYVK